MAKEKIKKEVPLKKDIVPTVITTDVSESQELVVRFSDLEGLQSKGLNSSFITDIKQGENEIWFSPNISDKKLVFKTPKSKSGYPETYEFTVSQFLNLLRTKPKNRKATNDELV